MRTTPNKASVTFVSVLDFVGPLRYDVFVPVAFHEPRSSANSVFTLYVRQIYIHNEQCIPGHGCWSWLCNSSSVNILVDYKCFLSSDSSSTTHGIDRQHGILIPEFEFIFNAVAVRKFIECVTLLREQNYVS